MDTQAQHGRSPHRVRSHATNPTPIILALMVITAACIPTVMANEQLEELNSGSFIQGLSIVETGIARADVAFHCATGYTKLQIPAPDLDAYFAAEKELPLTRAIAALRAEGYTAIPETLRVHNYETTVVSYKFLEFSKGQLYDLGTVVNDTAVEMHTRVMTQLYNRSLDDYQFLTLTEYRSSYSGEFTRLQPTVVPVNMTQVRNAIDKNPPNGNVSVVAACGLALATVAEVLAVPETFAATAGGLGAPVGALEMTAAAVQGTRGAEVAGAQSALEAASMAPLIFEILSIVVLVLLVLIVLYCAYYIVNPTYETVDTIVTAENKFDGFSLVPGGDFVHINWGSRLHYDKNDGSVYVKPFLYWWERPIKTGIIQHYIPNNTNLKIPTTFEIPNNTVITYPSADTTRLTVVSPRNITVTIVGPPRANLKFIVCAPRPNPNDVPAGDPPSSPAQFPDTSLPIT